MSSIRKLQGALTSSGRRAAQRAAAKARKGIRQVPGPSPNPATNLMIAEIAVASAGRVARRSMEKGLLKAKFEREQAVAIVEGRGMAHTMITAAIARVATRSLPGALLVGGGLFVKVVFDRSLSRRKARRRGDREIEQRVADADDGIL
ncbi:MAG TPA: hypothetical protein VIC34_16005 [Croceibacterium sp.]|jgi:hypothetical protein